LSQSKLPRLALATTKRCNKWKSWRRNHWAIRCPDDYTARQDLILGVQSACSAAKRKARACRPIPTASFGNGTSPSGAVKKEGIHAASCFTQRALDARGSGMGRTAGLSVLAAEQADCTPRIKSGEPCNHPGNESPSGFASMISICCNASSWPKAQGGGNLLWLNREGPTGIGRSGRIAGSEFRPRLFHQSRAAL